MKTWYYTAIGGTHTWKVRSFKIHGRFDRIECHFLWLTITLQRLSRSSELFALSGQPEPEVRSFPVDQSWACIYSWYLSCLDENTATFQSQKLMVRIRDCERMWSDTLVTYHMLSIYYIRYSSTETKKVGTFATVSKKMISQKLGKMIIPPSLDAQHALIMNTVVFFFLLNHFIIGNFDTVVHLREIWPLPVGFHDNSRVVTNLQLLLSPYTRQPSIFNTLRPE